MNATLTPRTECEEIVARLWPYLDGVLPESERDRVVSHLEWCAGCRSHRDFLEAFLEAVRRATPHPAGLEGLQARVERAIAEERGRGGDDATMTTSV